MFYNNDKTIHFNKLSKKLNISIFHKKCSRFKNMIYFKFTYIENTNMFENTPKCSYVWKKKELTTWRKKIFLFKIYLFIFKNDVYPIKLQETKRKGDTKKEKQKDRNFPMACFFLR